MSYILLSPLSHPFCATITYYEPSSASALIDAFVSNKIDFRNAICSDLGSSLTLSVHSASVLLLPCPYIALLFAVLEAGRDSVKYASVIHCTVVYPSTHLM